MTNVVVIPTDVDPKNVERAFAQRLEAVTPFLYDGPRPGSADTPALFAGISLALLVTSVHADPRPHRIWLLCTAVSGAFPTADDVVEGTRLFKRASILDATFWLLDLAVAQAGEGASELEVVTDQIIVDVDHSARHDLHTGIQQVVRRTLPIWTRDHEVLMVAWTEWTQCFRALSTVERDRALRRNGPPPGRPKVAIRPRLTVPWRTVVVLAETPPRAACERLAALAEFSGNVLVAIGYDCIPVVSADLVPQYEPGRFAQYLTIIKHAARVASISASATVEFRGFVEALPAQGIEGPMVIECALPAESVTAGEGHAASITTPAPAGAVPLVLSVGSLEPRKNHLALLFAAECLWREGHRFEVVLVGRGGWGDRISRRLTDLRAQGRPIEMRSDVSDQELQSLYRAARFTVFASLHEGYGLPVAESLSAGTPVITSNYGSTREIGAGAGALLIDPRDDEQIVNAIRALLVDDELLERLQTETTRRPARTWEQYAVELWETLVTPTLVADGRRLRW